MSDLEYKADLIERISTPIVALDHSLKIKFWSKSAEHIYGWKTGEVIGKTLFEVLQTKFIGIDASEVLKSLHSKGSVHVQATIRTKSGVHLWVDLVLEKILLPDGREDFAAIIRDVTMQNKADEILNESSREAGKLREGEGCTVEGVREAFNHNQCHHDDRSRPQESSPINSEQYLPGKEGTR